MVCVQSVRSVGRDGDLPIDVSRPIAYVCGSSRDRLGIRFEIGQIIVGHHFEEETEIVIVTSGWAIGCKYQTGCFGSPAQEAATAQ